MIEKLNGKQLRNYIAKYGDGDVYYAHDHKPNGIIEIQYLPKILHFVDPNGIPAFIKELNGNPHIVQKYVKVIVLTEKFAYIPNDNRSNKNPLVMNYSKFLQSIKSSNFEINK